MAKDVIASGIEKILYAVISILIIVYFIVPALGMFGIFQCTGCDSLTAIFALGVLPVAAVFISLYFIWKRFATS